MIRNPVSLLLGGAGLLALVFLPLLGRSANRLLSGQPVSVFAVPAAWPLALLGCLAVIFAVSFVSQRRITSVVMLVVALAIPVIYAWGAGAVAASLVAAASPMTRISIGPAGWALCVIAYLTVGEAVSRLSLGPLGRAVVLICVVAPIFYLLRAGRLDDLAILKEYAIKRDVFGDAVTQHLRIVAVSFLPAVVVGLPLGVWAHRSMAARGPLLSVLNIVQTVPSIALFGLLMAPLSYLARGAPWLADLGIRGIGLAPAAVALTLYSLLPIVRNTAAGLDDVPADSVDAAIGMGMNRWQILTRIEIPLSFPVILSGLRITLVQSIGLAAVAALIGAGGLGAIMFQGLFANTEAQILLGAVPIVIMAVTVDIVFRLIARALEPGRP